jgi:hypothetical protein
MSAHPVSEWIGRFFLAVLVFWAVVAVRLAARALAPRFGRPFALVLFWGVIAFFVVLPGSYVIVTFVREHR